MKDINKVREHIKRTESNPLPPPNENHAIAWVAILDFCESKGMREHPSRSPLESVLLYIERGRK
jgi:hypothetical protein